LSLDEFPEAFERFERVVDVDRIRSFDALRMQFSHWAGRKWLDTPRQNEALQREWSRILRERAALQPPTPKEKELLKYMEKVTRAPPQPPTKFSAKYKTMSEWKTHPHKTDYARRIERALAKHPGATLKEARGHKKR